MIQQHVHDSRVVCVFKIQFSIATAGSCEGILFSVQANAVSCSSAMLRAMLTRYELASKGHPLKVQIATGAVVMAAGECAAQMVVEGRQRLDAKRVAVSSTFSGLVISPALYRLMVAVDGFFPGQQASQVAKKAFAHQTICGPLLGPSFVVFSSLVEALLAGQLSSAHGCHAAVSHTTARLRQDFTNIWGASYTFWLPVNAINYGVVPPHLRIAFNTASACIYNTFLTWIAHRRVTEPPRE